MTELQEEDRLLDLWWTEYPDHYMEYWEPEIEGWRMLGELRRREPDRYKTLTLMMRRYTSPWNLPNLRK